MVVRPRSVGPRGSWASCLSFALQLALVLQVPVGCLLPCGSHPSRWGHPCGVEASLSSIGTKVVTKWVRCLGQFTPMRALRLALVLRPFYLWMGFEPLSEASLRTLSLQVCFLVVLAEDESLRLFLALSSVPCPMLWWHVRLGDTCSRSRVFHGALPWILPDGVGASVGGSCLRPAAACAFFPGGPRCDCVSSGLLDLSIVLP